MNCVHAPCRVFVLGLKLVVEIHTVLFILRGSMLFEGYKPVQRGVNPELRWRQSLF